MYTDLERPPLGVAPLRRALVRPGSPWTELRVVPVTGSTNADVASAARAGAPQGLVVVAESQEAGRGRADRRWIAPPRAGLTFSVLFRPTEVPAARWGWLPLLAGVALRRAILTVAQVEASLKWPNDLLLGPSRHKSAGLLAEVAGGGVVLGIGLNVTTRRDELPRADATSLALEGAAVTDRDTLLRAVLRDLGADYVTWCEHAGDPAASGLRAAYLESCTTVGQRVRVELPTGDALVGEAVDVDTDGRLVVDTAAGPRQVAAGDIVHVR